MECKETDMRSKLGSCQIRPASLADVDAIYEIESKVFYSGWTRNNISSELVNNRNTEGYILECEGNIIGYYFGWHICEESSLNNLAIHPDAQGLGLASVLMRHFLNKAQEHNTKETYLEVSTLNKKAIALYEKFGFTIVGLRENYYEKAHEDAYIMKRTEGEFMCLI